MSCESCKKLVSEHKAKLKAIAKKESRTQRTMDMLISELERYLRDQTDEEKMKFLRRFISFNQDNYGI